MNRYDSAMTSLITCESEKENLFFFSHEMAFYRKYRRTGRRYARKGRSGYSMYKLYKSRSSGAQARQIYGLNKKLKRIQRLTKPEINIAPLVQSTMRSDQGTAIFTGSYVKLFKTQLTNLISQDAQATEGYSRLEGRFARIQNITLKGTFTYLNAETSLTLAYDLQRQPAYARVVIYQTKTSRGQELDSRDVFSVNTSGTVADSTGSNGALLGNYALMRAPLALGLARTAKVISDKLYMISDTKQAIMIKTKLKYVRNWYQAPNDSAPKGGVWMMVLLYNTSAGVNNEDIVASSECRLDIISKCVYTDA